MIYPEALKDLIEYLKKLPSIGEKSAERLALSILDLDLEDVNEFASSLIKVKNNLKPCNICGNITEGEICQICSSENRNKNIICIVEDYKSLYAFEKMGKFFGTYHILNGLISPINGISPSDINISSLIKRLEDNKDVELIIAVKPTIEGETTTAYINKILEKKNIKISRLSYGLPMGTELDYLDSLTLERAFEDRKKIS